MVDYFNIHIYLLVFSNLHGCNIEFPVLNGNMILTSFHVNVEHIVGVKMIMRFNKGKFTCISYGRKVKNVI